MNRCKPHLTIPFRLGSGALVLFLAASAFSAVPCDRIKSQPDAWVTGRVNALVTTARRAYESDLALTAYERVLDGISRAVQQCRLASEGDFAKRYPEFVGYVSTLALERQPDHELGFNVPDSVYFSETRAFVTIPEFLLAPNFLRTVSRFATLPQAKAQLREMNAGRAIDDQLIFFSYQSRHLGTPDNPDSFWRLLIVVPGNAAQGVPEKWVQFGVPDPRARAPVRNVSVVSVVAGADGTNTYFKDYFRTYRRNGSITIKGRWELGEGDDNCALCHKSGILPIFPVNGTVSRDELEKVRLVNERFLKYGRPRFDKYLDASKLGPGLGATSNSESVASAVNTTGGIDGVRCGACHQPNGLGALNWPMDRTLISSYVKGGEMPLGFELTPLERNRLYKKIIQDYFAIDEKSPGTLKSWLLGRRRSADISADTRSLP